MAISLEELLEDTFTDLQNVSTSKMEKLIHETIRELTDLEIKMKSTNPEDRKEALARAQALKEAFEVQTKSMCEKAGIDPEKFSMIAGEMVPPPAPEKKEPLATPKKMKKPRGIKG